MNKDAIKIKKGPNGIKSKRGFQSLVKYSKKKHLSKFWVRSQRHCCQEKKKSRKTKKNRKSCYLHFKLGALTEYDIGHMSTIWFITQIIINIKFSPGSKNFNY